MSDLYTVERPGGPPSLVEAAAALHKPIEDLDAGYGVVTVDPRRGLYAVRAKSGAPSAKATTDSSGPYSDPQIAPFGPPR